MRRGAKVRWDVLAAVSGGVDFVPFPQERNVLLLFCHYQLFTIRYSQIKTDVIQSRL